MSEILSIDAAFPANFAPRSVSLSPTPTAATQPTDQAEFSSVARLLGRVSTESSFRTARTNAIRAEIAAGTFETPERIRGTVERLLDVIA
ncbi:MAG: hypothetical protein HY763_11845 [Planctomycetes bacterium]|nr:hypothetical protein [Planctomycetota bacterium]